MDEPADKEGIPESWLQAEVADEVFIGFEGRRRDVYFGLAGNGCRNLRLEQGESRLTSNTQGCPQELRGMAAPKKWTSEPWRIPLAGAATSRELGKSLSGARVLRCSEVGRGKFRVLSRLGSSELPEFTARFGIPKERLNNDTDKLPSHAPFEVFDRFADSSHFAMECAPGQRAIL
jgi:hypothetical protein